MKTRFLRTYLPEIFLLGIAIPLIFRLYKLSLDSASDFEVYWYAIHAWVSGQNPYAQYSTVYPGLVFKYPPWILPLFLPFAWLSLSASKWIWTTVQIICIFYSMNWLSRCGISRRLVCFVSLIFWWMWLAHVHFGQIMVFLLAFALWAHGTTGKAFGNSSRIAGLTFLFTSKVFSMVSLLGIFKKILKLPVILTGFVFLALSHILLLLTFPFEKLNSRIIQNLYQDWIHAASSGGADLGAKIVRGQQNHGFVAAILRNLNIGATVVQFDVLVAALLAALFSFLWNFYSKNLSSEEKWAGWLSIGVIAHPLAWHHSFTITYPLCVFSLHRSIQSKNKRWIILSLLGVSCIALFIPQVIGVDAVIPLEYIGSKSWGVLLSAIALILASKGDARLRKAEITS